jgi:hypothetical protein
MNSKQGTSISVLGNVSHRFKDSLELRDIRCLYLKLPGAYMIYVVYISNCQGPTWYMLFIFQIARDLHDIRCLYFRLPWTYVIYVVYISDCQGPTWYTLFIFQIARDLRYIRCLYFNLPGTYMMYVVYISNCQEVRRVTNGIQQFSCCYKLLYYKFWDHPVETGRCQTAGTSFSPVCHCIQMQRNHS